MKCMPCRVFGGRIIVVVLRFRPTIRVISQIYRQENKGKMLDQSGATDVIDKTGLDRLITFWGLETGTHKKNWKNRFIQV